MIMGHNSVLPLYCGRSYFDVPAAPDRHPYKSSRIWNRSGYMTVSDVFCLRGSSSAAPVWQLIFQKQPDVRFVAIHQQLLGNDALQVASQLNANLLLLVFGKDVDDTIHCRCRILSMQSCQNKMSGFGSRIAVAIVSVSRISPTRITSGSHVMLP